MKSAYGDFTKEQIMEYKKSLHASVHWLLIYKEENYEFLDKYFESLMVRVGAFNKILAHGQEVLKLLVALQSARDEAAKSEDAFVFKTYRKLILDAHTVIDEIKEEE